MTRGHAAGLKDRRSERDALDRLVNAVRGGQSQALVMRGDPGVGKTALVEGLALAIVQGDVPEHLKAVRLVALE